MSQHFAFWCWLISSFVLCASLGSWFWRRWGEKPRMSWRSLWAAQAASSPAFPSAHPPVTKTVNVLRAEELNHRPGIRSVLPAFLVFCLAAVTADAGPADAVVRLPSHGGSGTVVATGDGWSLILSCAHCFEGESRNKPVVVNMASSEPGPARKVGSKVLLVGRADDVDLSLIRLNAGPVPYVTPVAPLSVRAVDCWSAGFDRMTFPPHCRPAKIVGSWNANTTITYGLPWHGRSGGALIDKQTGYLVGVVSAYGCNQREWQEYHPTAKGIYVSLPAIHRFLARAGAMQGTQEMDPPQRQLQQPFRQPPPGPGGH